MPIPSAAEMAEADGEYTLADHEFRGDDAYALGKYRITARWLRASSARGVLYNIGCGAGEFNQTAVAMGFDVRAFEPDPAAYELAQARCPDGCKVEHAGLEEINGNALADVIVMHDVLEHIEDDHAAVARLLDLAKPTAEIILSVPALPRLYGFHDEQLGHYRRYTRKTLRTALEPRLSIERLRSYGTALIPVTLWFSRWRRRPYPTGKSSGGGAVSRIMGATCRFEERIPGPIGTSLICLARPRAGSTRNRSASFRVGL